MSKVLNHANVSTEPLITLKTWQILLLNSVVPQQHRGHLGKEQLEFLNRRLAERPDLKALIFLHHPPVTIGR